MFRTLTLAALLLMAALPASAGFGGRSADAA